MSVLPQFYVVNFGYNHNKGGKQKYVQLVQVGFDPDEGYDEASSFMVAPAKRSNDQLPIMTFETFKKLCDLYPPKLIAMVQNAFNEFPKITYFKSVEQVEGWEKEFWTEEKVRESVGAYI